MDLYLQHFQTYLDFSTVIFAAVHLLKTKNIPPDIIYMCVYSRDMTLKLNQFLQHAQKLRYEKDTGQWFALSAASSLI